MKELHFILFRPPETIDPVVVDEELDFFDIDLVRMIANFEAEEAAKNIPVPPTLSQRINQSVSTLPKGLGDSE